MPITLLSEDALVKELERFAQSLPGYLAAAVVDETTGIPLAVNLVDPDFPVRSLAAHLCGVFAAGLEALRTAHLADDRVDDVVITMGRTILLVRFLDDNVFLLVVADRSRANEGTVRIATARHLGALIA